MRGFLILCFVAAVSANGQGYNYQPASGVGDLSGAGSGFSSGHSSGIGLGSGSLGLSSGHSSGIGFGSGSLGLSSGHSSGIGLGGGSLGLSSGHSSGIGLGGGSLGLSSGSVGRAVSAPVHVSAPTVTEFNKEYYFHSAPEEEFHDASANNRVSSTLKKNLRVVFIKAPENNALNRAALQVVRQAVEDRTAIYVLTKQNDVSDFTQQLQQINEIKSLKPEVRFIKYRTAQDAINAQRAIQAQYDALGGSSRSSNEGIAPVLNYASSQPTYSGSELSSSGSSSTGFVAGPSTSYIPPQKSYLPPVSF